MNTVLIIYSIINIVLLVAIHNEGHVVPKTSDTRAKVIEYLVIFLFGVIIFIGIILVMCAQPIWIRAKWYRRQRKIKMAIKNKEKRERPKDTIVGIF